MKEEKFFRFCPNCGSVNVKPVYFGLSQDFAAHSPEMKCIDCGFNGFIVESTAEQIAAFRKEMKRKVH